MTSTAPTAPSDRSAGSRPTRRKRLLLLVVVPLVLLAIGGLVWLHGGRYVATDNAYLKADKVPISADVAAQVRSVLVSANEAVHAGQPLFRLDPAAFELTVAEARAHLAQVRTELAALQASLREQQAAIALAQSQVAYARREQKRLENLVDRHLVATSKVDEAEQATRLAELQLAAAERERQRIEQALGGDIERPIEQHPSYLAAQSALEQAELDLRRTEVVAPTAGVVSNLPKVGQYLHAGETAMALVVDGDLWIEANFPETDLTYVRPGQPVAVEVDMFPGIEWHGEVESLSPATGAEFSLIPAQNATGNWVKITQRVPVRIRLADNRDAPPLRAGLSAQVRVDTGHRRRVFGVTL